MEVPLVVLKLTITPLVIGALTLAARRWGHGIAGLLVGLPLTSGPVSVFLAIEHGTDFARGAAAGTIGGIMAVCLYILAYGHTARRWTWPVSLAVGLGAFFVLAPILATKNPALVPVGVLCSMFLVGTYLLLPKAQRRGAGAPAPPWDLPLRMIAATALVLGLTAAAETLGPAWTGVLSPFPVFTAVLGVFTQRHDGAAAVHTLLKGLVLGLFSFVAFFVVVGLALETFSLPMVYLMAATTALVVNAAAWGFAHRRPTLLEAEAGPD